MVPKVLFFTLFSSLAPLICFVLSREQNVVFCWLLSFRKQFCLAFAQPHHIANITLNVNKKALLLLAFKIAPAKCNLYIMKIDILELFKMVCFHGSFWLFHNPFYVSWKGGRKSNFPLYSYFLNCWSFTKAQAIQLNGLIRTKELYLT